jgi:hypothetical protein
MAHCPFARLADLGDVLDEIRGWPGIREPSPGVFYVKQTPFLHFHVNAGGRRWADARVGAAWGAEIDVPEPASRTAAQRFLREVRRRYRATASGGAQARSGAGTP